MNGEEIGKLLLKRERVVVSNHAIEQFRKRIADLPYEAAKNVIAEGVQKSEKVKLLPDGGTMRVRTRRPFPYEFRAMVVYDEGHEAPVVTTVLKGDSKKIRKRRNRGDDILLPGKPRKF
ncbi:MAG: hypothetical protein ACK5NT_12560 [Pyrinomonadaceae bacterium]